MSISELDDYLKANPRLIQSPTAAAIISGVEGRYKPDEGFKDLLGRIKGQHPDSKINDWR